MDIFGPLLTEFLACANAALSPAPGRALVAPGLDVAWDDCCEGQVWVRLITVQPSGRPFPQFDAAQQCGATLWAATIGIGVVRCVSVVDDQGRAPTPAQLNADSVQMTADMDALREAIQCCMAVNDRLVKFSRWDALGPQGGCAGGEWQVVAALDNCACT